MNRYAVTATHVTEHTESGDITRERTVTKKAPLGTPRTRGVRRRQTPRRRPIWKMMSGYRTPAYNGPGEGGRGSPAGDDGCPHPG